MPDQAKQTANALADLAFIDGVLQVVQQYPHAYRAESITEAREALERVMPLLRAQACAPSVTAEQVIEVAREKWPHGTLQIAFIDPMDAGHSWQLSNWWGESVYVSADSLPALLAQLQPEPT